MSDDNILPGWTCLACQAFNGDAKERLQRCRACAALRPIAAPTEPGAFSSQEYRDITARLVEACRKSNELWRALPVLVPADNKDLQAWTRQEREVDASAFELVRLIKRLV
jgi:hypothetical protein